MKAILCAEARIDAIVIEQSRTNAAIEYHRSLMQRNIAAMIEEATRDGRTYIVRRWRGEEPDQCMEPYRILIREYIFITLPDVQMVRNVGDVVLSDEFTRTASVLSDDRIVRVPLDFLNAGEWTLDPSMMGKKVKIADMRRKSIMLPIIDEWLIVWECVGIEG